MKNAILTLLATTLSFYSIAQKQKQTEFHIDETYTLSKIGTVYLNAHDAKVTIIGEN